jgi:DNA-binding NarL/FixJ family response regulator
VEEAVSHQPDVVVMDLHMPGLNGIEATRHVVHHSPHVAVLVLTMFEDDASVFAAMRAGARGYLLKGARGTGLYRSGPQQRCHCPPVVPEPEDRPHHVSNILSKLQVADRAQAIVRARKAGLGRSSGSPQ